MTVETLLKRKSFQSLFRLLINRRSIRNKVLGVIEAKSYKALVEDNPQGRPRRVQEDKHDYLMALLLGFDRAIQRGLISKHVMNRLLDVFVGNVILTTEREEAARSLGFAPPLFILVSPTGKCNLRCVGCYAASDPGNHASLDFDTFDRILTEKRELWGSHFTVISGGEPFMWRDGQRGLLDMVARHPSDLFMVYTNSTLITDDVAKRMAELGNITPAISVEGFEEETDARRGKGVYRRILTAFENLRRHGVPFGVSATPTRLNWETIVSDRFTDFYFEGEGAVYGWLFQYMPIGRGQSLDLMVPPEQRVAMLGRMQRLVRERKVFLADFWNSGTVSNGCICAGRSGGYFYIDWNGNIAPCGFVPYATDNIYTIYANGGSVNTALDSPLFKQIRAWQDQYGYAEPGERTQNWLCPCVIRDHFQLLKEAVCDTRAKPINEEAAIALRDGDYCRGMAHYGQELKQLADPIWAEQYVDTPT
ncbi:MAG: radical SAM protein [Planctomycetes bacterium]|nr:radical SAM protein [Planctomycetota bacterium]